MVRRARGVFVFSSGRVRVSVTCRGVDRSTSPRDMMSVCVFVCPGTFLHGQ
jgi:hypothetical protein